MAGFFYKCERCGKAMRNNFCDRCEDSQKFYSESGVLYIPSEPARCELPGSWSDSDSARNSDTWASTSDGDFGGGGSSGDY